MKKQYVLIATIMILLFGIGSAFGQDVSEEAKRHFDRGLAAVEMAKSPNDYAAAINEFEQAARLAPDWPDVYYNLGKVQEAAEKYGDAARSFREYLRLAPDAEDAEEIKSLISKLEYKAIPVPSVAKGALGVPWGSNADTIIEIMMGKGYRVVKQTNRYISFQPGSGGTPQQTFWLINDSLYEASNYWMVRTSSQDLTRNAYESLSSDFNREFGRFAEEIVSPRRANDGVMDPKEMRVWNVVDERTGDQYLITVNFQTSWFAHIKGRTYTVDVTYEASSLRQRLENKETDTSAKPQPISPPQDVNAKDSYGCTPLHEAAMISDQKDQVESLISKGANINAKNNRGETPLHWAALNTEDKEIACKIINMLITKGADVNSKDNMGNTPLHGAAFGGFREVAELLITKGADVDAKNNEGQTPLNLALQRERSNMADLLRKHGAK